MRDPTKERERARERSKRSHPVKARTVSLRLLTKPRLALTAEEYPADVVRPVTRGDCADGPRPCPWVSCRYHLYAEITLYGGLRIAFPDKEPEELEHSCSLDVAEDWRTYEEIADVLNITREGVRLALIEAEYNLAKGLARETGEPVTPELVHSAAPSAHVLKPKWCSQCDRKHHAKGLCKECYDEEYFLAMAAE